jgi:hypothetical protein
MLEEMTSRGHRDRRASHGRKQRCSCSHFFSAADLAKMDWLFVSTNPNDYKQDLDAVFAR